VLSGVVQARHERTPVQDRPVPATDGGAHEFQRVGRDLRRVRLDALVIDTGIGQQQRHLEIHELIQPPDVAGFHLVAGDDEHVVPQAPAIEIGQHCQRVRPDSRQKRIRRTVEDLHRGDVRLKVTVADQPLHGFGIGHQRTWLALVPQAVGVPDAVGAVQRATLNVIQAQPALAVLDHLTRTRWQALDLMPVQQRNERTHVGPPRMSPWNGRGVHWESTARIGQYQGTFSEFLEINWKWPGPRNYGPSSGTSGARSSITRVTIARAARP
jgi:hypothetical protein